MLLLIDNFDSFTYNVAHYLTELGAEVVVKRNNELTLSIIESLSPSHLVISPGPCTPDDAGISLAAIEYFAGKIPILGVCLGHQSIGQVFGGKIIRARQVMHGKNSPIFHRNSGVFAGLPNPVDVTRYHSLVVDKTCLPDCLEITAWTQKDNGEMDEIMGFRHRTLDVEGVQFHPEAVLTQEGHAVFKNFLTR
ncbi:anthranilate synthase component II [Neptunomonas phycophila]|jgi:anthranilate synthase/aminodeoxychorismate synthase-like glutamine amidotransferase|uniref:anthranilate synthase component II n=1 Tax=Neptunomonas phycophila TaxID=1572645 RepID=UPI0015BC6A17|nr:aminodeoxychorismate/anthranilate synthase component II [Neptunomonas phycophila]QLE96880.1 aminodeoxychorismate/anthranilate synthase component II [Neptunomonas phycophila]